MNRIHRLFFFLTIFFLPSQLGRHFWPSWSFVLGRRIDYLSPTVYFTDILIFLTLSLWFAQHLQFRHSRANGNLSFIKSWIPTGVYPVLCYGAGMTTIICINILFATSKPIATYHWLKVLEFSLFGFYTVKTKPEISKIIFFLAIGMLFSSILALMQFFLQRSVGGIFWWFGERTFSDQTPGIAQLNVCLPGCRLLLRPYATFPHPNVLGGFLAISLPFLIRQIQLLNRSTKKFFLLISFFAGVAALFVTISRSAWLAGLLGVAFVVIPKKFKLLFTILSVVIFLLGILLVKDFAGTSESVIVRQELSTSAITIFQQSPIAGVGLGNFLVTLPRYLPMRSVYFLQPVHNIYLLLLSETGILGSVFLLSFLFRVFKNFQFSVFNFQFLLTLLLGLVDHYFLTLQSGQLLLTVVIGLTLIEHGHFFNALDSR